MSWISALRGPANLFQPEHPMPVISRKIWIDLDNTLVWVWQPQVTDPFVSKVTGVPIEMVPPAYEWQLPLRQIRVAERFSMFACARPRAISFLGKLRGLAEVRLLTSAERGYAEALNGALRLGFKSSEITARGEFGTSVDPAGVLVENVNEFPGDFRHYERQRLKIRHLGRYATLVEVPFFSGSKGDPFQKQWKDCVRKIEQVLVSRKRTLNYVELQRLRQMRKWRQRSAAAHSDRNLSHPKLRAQIRREPHHPK